MIYSDLLSIITSKDKLKNRVMGGGAGNHIQAALGFNLLQTDKIK